MLAEKSEVEIKKINGIHNVVKAESSVVYNSIFDFWEDEMSEDEKKFISKTFKEFNRNEFEDNQDNSGLPSDQEVISLVLSKRTGIYSVKFKKEDNGYFVIKSYLNYKQISIP